MKRNRSTLKEYFKKGAIPTDSNFADLIDSMLNQEEDNVVKLPNDPLKIVATGADEAVLNFYRIEQNQDQLTWQVKQKPGGKAGLSIGDATGSRLFVENGTGNLGIGTTSPKARLHVNGALTVTGTALGKEASLDLGATQIGQLTDIYGARASWDSDSIFIGLKNEAENRKDSIIAFGDDPEESLRILFAKWDVEPRELVRITSAGYLGIGATAPRTALDTGTGVMSGAPNDYMKAQFTMSGGGTVSWGGPGQRLKWTNRFIAISMERSISFPNGHVNIYQPTANIPAGQVYDGAARSATADGVVLNHWEALYAVHTVGGIESAVSFQIVRYTHNFNAPSNWLLVAVVNGDDSSIKLGTGVSLSRNSAVSQGSSIPRGIIMMWSGETNTIPDGWALCDGGNGTPNLEDRFIVGAGNAYKVGETGGANTVTLTVAQMPSHNHNNGEYGVLLHRDGSGRWTSKDTDTTVGEPDLIHNADIVAAGGNQAHENRPPYYALAYIMKL